VADVFARRRCDRPDVETFVEALKRWRDAEHRDDAAALDAILDADFRGDGPHGVVLGKREWLARGRLRAEALEWTRIEVRADNQTAIAMGTLGGVVLCTVVAIRRDERWTIVNLQVSELATLRPANRPPGRCPASGGART
jgi:hypothetical protein